MATPLTPLPKLKCGRLPKTGVTVSQRTGDDGATQRGANGSRWIIYASGERAGTVYDRHTGLLWPRSPHLMIPGDPVEIDDGVNMVLVGRGDWSNSTLYEVGDCVQDPDESEPTFFVCIISHGSAFDGLFSNDRDANPTYWRQTTWIGSATNLVTPATSTWQEAIDKCNNLSYAGISPGGWRLANAIELASLLDWSKNPAPYLDQSTFPNCPVPPNYVYFWTATTLGIAPSTYAVCLRYTEQRSFHGQPMTSQYYAWPVHDMVRGV